MAGMAESNDSKRVRTPGTELFVSSQDRDKAAKGIFFRISEHIYFPFGCIQLLAKRAAYRLARVTGLTATQKPRASLSVSPTEILDKTQVGFMSFSLGFQMEFGRASCAPTSLELVINFPR